MMSFATAGIFLYNCGLSLPTELDNTSEQISFGVKMRSRLIVSFFPAAFVLFVLNVAVAQVSLIERISSVNATDFSANFGSGVSESDFTDQFGLFDSSVSIVNTGTVASQTSNVTQAIFDIQLSVESGTTDPDIDEDFIGAEAISSISVDFEVSAPVTFSFDGTLSGLIGEVLLDELGGSNLFSENTAQSSPVNVFFEQDLLPGSYSFSVRAQSFGAGGFGGGATADVLATFSSTSVPEPNSSLLICIAIALSAISRRQRGHHPVAV